MALVNMYNSNWVNGNLGGRDTKQWSGLKFLLCVIVHQNSQQPEHKQAKLLLASIHKSWQICFARWIQVCAVCCHKCTHIKITHELDLRCEFYRTYNFNNVPVPLINTVADPGPILRPGPGSGMCLCLFGFVWVSC